MEGSKSADILKLEARSISAKKQQILGNTQDAITIWSDLILENPKQGLYDFELAKIYEQEQNEAEALSHAKAAVKKDPNNEWYLQLLANLASEQQQYELAIENYKKLYAQFPERSIYLENIAFNQLAAGDAEGSLKTLDKYEKATGLNVFVCMQKFRIYAAEKNEAEAIHILESCIAANPEDLELKRRLGNYFLEIDKKEKARLVFESILEVKPDDDLAMVQLAQLKGVQSNSNPDADINWDFIKSRDIPLKGKILQLVPFLDKLPADELWYTSLIEQTDELLKVHGPKPEIYSIQGDVHALAQYPERAISSYEQALNLNDKMYAIWDLLCYQYLLTGQLDQMENWATKAYDLFPNEAMAYYYYGRILLAQEQYDALETVITEGELVAASNTYYQALFSTLKAMQPKHANKAAAWEKAYALSGEPLVAFNYGNYLLEQGDMKNIKNLVQACDQSKNCVNDISMIELKANYFAQNDQKTQAKQLYQFLVAHVPSSQAFKDKLKQLD